MIHNKIIPSPISLNLVQLWRVIQAILRWCQPAVSTMKWRIKILTRCLGLLGLRRRHLWWLQLDDNHSHHSRAIITHSLPLERTSILLWKSHTRFAIWYNQSIVPKIYQISRKAYRVFWTWLSLSLYHSVYHLTHFLLLMPAKLSDPHLKAVY